MIVQMSPSGTGETGEGGGAGGGYCGSAAGVVEPQSVKPPILMILSERHRQDDPADSHTLIGPFVPLKRSPFSSMKSKYVSVANSVAVT